MAAGGWYHRKGELLRSSFVRHVGKVSSRKHSAKQRKSVGPLKFTGFHEITIFFCCKFLRIFCTWSAIIFCVICAKPEVLSKNVNFPTDHDIFKQFDQNWKFQHRNKQLKVFYQKFTYKKIWLCYSQYWLLSVTKTLNEGTKIKNIEIQFLLN